VDRGALSLDIACHLAPVFSHLSRMQPQEGRDTCITAGRAGYFARLGHI